MPRESDATISLSEIRKFRFLLEFDSMTWLSSTQKPEPSQKPKYALPALDRQATLQGKLRRIQKEVEYRKICLTAERTGSGLESAKSLSDLDPRIITALVDRDAKPIETPLGIAVVGSSLTPKQIKQHISDLVEFKTAFSQTKKLPTLHEHPRKIHLTPDFKPTKAKYRQKTNPVTVPFLQNHIRNFKAFYAITPV